MIDMSVTWIDPPVGNTSHEKPPFRCIKNNSRPKTAILSGDLPSSMCGLRLRRYKCVGSEIEGTLAGNIFSQKSGPAPVCAFTFSIFLLKIEADVRSGHRVASPVG
jgi:hypothetical protein